MIFVTSDQHFDHDNIIRFQRRPFSDAGAMNKKMRELWNDVVEPGDTVLFLGDLTKPPRVPASIDWTDEWLGQLNGLKVLVQGNHDPYGFGAPFLVIEYDGYNFLLIHDPAMLPFTWDGWVIHGHHHANHPEKYPLINRANRTVNVSVEHTGYAPISLNDIVRMIEGGAPPAGCC